MTTTYVTEFEIYTGTVASGDTVIVEAEGETNGVAVSGSEVIEGDGVSYQDTILAGGSLTADNLAIISRPTIEGGTLNITADMQSPDEVIFSGRGGLLKLSTSAAESSPPISGFSAGDDVSIAGLSTSGTLSLAVSRPNTVVITDKVANGPTETYSLDVSGATASDLQVADVNGVVTLECVCFLAGTTIATPEGGRAIETLRAGDLVLAADGAARPVRWLGRQTIATRFADTLRVAPIRIREGALGDLLPVRDLLVSPDHALMIDGVFVQAGALVNFLSITREDADMPETFVYFHIELADHSLILAEGVLAETFIDNVDRLAFDNWDEHAALGDDAAPMRELPYARAKAHRQVPQSLRGRLMARGVELCGRHVASVA